MMETQLHIIRTSRDSKTRDFLIEERSITALYSEAANAYTYSDRHRDEWFWAFGQRAAIPSLDFQVGYSRYYGQDREKLRVKFLESRRERVEEARAALRGAEEQLAKAEEFCKEVVNG